MNRIAVRLKTVSGSPFSRCLQESGQSPLRRERLRELQVNVGRLCNQACHHCHVDAGPKRTEIMTWETMEKILEWTQDKCITSVDVTGGAPEINPHFRRFVDRFLALGLSVTARCNLTVLLEPEQQDLAAWYAQRKIRLVGSLPCYTQKNVDAQRGDGVFDKSIEALRQLNTAGYGRDAALVLDLVYNPGGAFLPGEQETLESDYKQHLREDFGIVFSRLMTITNLPINRFAHFLERTNQYDSYMQLLENNFNPATVPGLMCRHLISVDWLGRVYDCDFNQMLDLPLGDKPHRYLWDLNTPQLDGTPIAVDSHCLGCTAGAGSSCGGALA
ncbi:MAG: arsenosugar biosynthesis radical SAM protein ArsS [Gammaproteobacteria bacterium]|nr:arsenosugar biosynthesis radical SAM protein ArsS [Gammaproteobacteria bacterium]MDH3370338.1 arsenosugar biosynthesis radical SAM protein ArsS [Gammaproteobacteria bacterium]MDH3406139.1 arsenosugar biosynthesis radical SAM protein ArsS [Gammaproteobacteria bacterium]MDH3562398.1 arsenosugar biosynthesis radical SAM protein ArsS [Gammaproteobacteria bacterium]MDH5487381.1 arsenosugar biosynthesis radical SAM protein ArsS [Gammaproteobacteria bacterium]